MGDMSFGKNGEWTKSGMLQVQYHDVTDAANLETWRGMSYQTVVTPQDQETGKSFIPTKRQNSRGTNVPLGRGPRSRPADS